MRNSDKKPADESSPPKRALDSGGRLQRCGNGLWLSSAAAWSLSGMAVAVREASKETVGSLCVRMPVSSTSRVVSVSSDLLSSHLFVFL